MATIRKHGTSFQVIIRKKGYPSVTKTFSNHQTAKTFVKDIESKMERGIFQDASLAEHTTLSDLLELYKLHILPSKKGKDVEGYRIQTLKDQLGSYTLIQLRPHTVWQTS